MSKPQLCNDCVYQYARTYELRRCLHPSYRQIYTGEHDVDYPTCQSVRQQIETGSGCSCYEPREHEKTTVSAQPTWSQRVKAWWRYHSGGKVR